MKNYFNHFLPPYQDGSELSVEKGKSEISGGIQTKMNKEMLHNKWGKCSKQLFAQFMYRIHKLQETNNNIKICLICKPLYFTGESYKIFREKFFLEFGFENGLVGRQLKRHQLPHLHVTQAAGGKQAVLALEVKRRQVNQRVGIRHELLVFKNHPVHIAG